MTKLKYSLQAIIVAILVPFLVGSSLIHPVKMLAVNLNVPGLSKNQAVANNHDKSSFAVYPELVYPHFVNH